jgi:hypothetical protein
MKRKLTAEILMKIVLFFFVPFLLVSCDTPLLESDVPEEEWVVTEVLYDPAYGDITIKFGEGMGFHQEYTYYEGFSGKVFVDWKKRLVLPENFSVSSIDDWYNGITVTDKTKPVLPSGAIVYFSDAWFYEVESESGIPTSNYRAKIRISTRSFPITITEDIPVL